MAKPKKQIMTIEIPFRTIFKIVLVIIGFWAVARLQTVIFYLLFSTLFAVALHPMVIKMEGWGLKRGFALGLVLMAVVGGFVALIGVSAVSLVGTITDFLDELPEQLESLKDNSTLAPVVTDVQSFLRDLNIGVVAEQGLSTGSTLIAGASKVFEATLFIFFFTVYMLLEHKYLIKIVRAIVPEEWSAKSNDIMSESVRVIGGYIRGQFAASLLMGIASYIIYRALGLPNALALAIIAGLTDVIPVVGGLIGLIPSVVIAATVSPVKALLTIILIQVYSTINNNAIKPAIFGDSLDLSPFIVAVSAVVGLYLFGAAGVILSLPIAGIVGFVLTKYKGIPILVEGE